MDVDGVLERMRSAYQVSDLQALAIVLGKDEKTFRVWRTRKTIPSSVLLKCSSDTKAALDWLSATGSTGNQVREPSPSFFGDKTKQINLTPEELRLLQNYRAATPSGRKVLDVASEELAHCKPPRGATKKAA